MAIEGLDVEAVTQLSQQLKSQADGVQNVVNAINSLVSNIPSIWQGQDAKDFEHWWASQHRPALENARQAIEGLSQSAMNNANAQRDASSH